MRKIYLFFILQLLVVSVSGQNLDTLSVRYVDEAGKTQMGSIVCNRQITDKLERIFEGLYKARYTIASIRPISDFGNDDETSMRANNTSCYCNRNISGTTRKSKHALGLAIDINPLHNPCITYKDGRVVKVEPATANPKKHQITHSDLAYKLFIKEGFRWGGDWRTKKDYQHFEY